MVNMMLTGSIRWGAAARMVSPLRILGLMAGHHRGVMEGVLPESQRLPMEMPQGKQDEGRLE